MDRFWGFFITKRSFSYLVIFTLVLFGLFSLLAIPKESSPEVRVPVGIVTTILPGASSEDVEHLVTDEIEAQLQGNLTNLKKLTSTSAEGVSSIVAEFEADAPLDASIQELRDEVDKVRGSLPSEAEDPVVSEVNFVDQPILTFAIGGNLDPRGFAQLSDELEDEIEAITGVARLGISGLREHEAHVVVRRDALAQFDLSITEVVNAIRFNNASLPIGDITLDNVNYALSFEGELESIEDLPLVQVGTRGGAPILLRDIAEIEDTFAEEVTRSRVSINGAPSEAALSFDVYKRQGGDITAVTEAVNERLVELQQPGELLEGLDVLVVFDTGEYVKRDLIELGRTGIIAVILVMITLFLTLGWREALIAGSSIPLSVVAAFIGLYYSGNTLNFVSLFSLILAVGILVDTGIVVVESIHTKITEGLTPEAAARETLREFTWPLTAGTFTTIAVFAPLFLISGVTGQFIANIPFTIITVLLASIFVALGLLPVLSVLFLKARSETRFEALQEDYTHRIQAWYRRQLGKILGNRSRENTFMALMALSLVVAIALPATGIIKTEFFPAEDADFFVISIERPEGSTLADTDLEVRKVEEILYEDDRIASFTTTVGQSSAFAGGGGANTKSANIFVNLETEREDTSFTIIEDTRRVLAVLTSVEISVDMPASGPPVGDPVVITFSGNDIDDLERAVAQAETLLEDIEGTLDVRTSTENDSIQFVYSVDRLRAAQLGISPLTVAQTLRSAIHGTEATTIKTADEDIAVIVSLDLAAPGATTASEIPLAAIEQIELPTPNGSVLLGSLLERNISRSNTSIAHEDGKRIATVSSQLAPGGNALSILNTFSERANELDLPPGITYSVGGENEDAQQAFAEMFRAFILGIVLMLAILVIQFNSFRHALYLLLIIPLSLFGVMIGLLVSNNPISFPSLMGVIALAGVIVNHVIILTDLILTLRRARPDEPMETIVTEASTRRLRPIVLTTITTILGLVPLIFVSALWAPLAYAIMFGLAFAVTITLVFIPILYRRWPGSIGHRIPLHKK